eukprot:1525711-Amphidinium_carterae.1
MHLMRQSMDTNKNANDLAGVVSFLSLIRTDKPCIATLPVTLTPTMPAGSSKAGICLTFNKRGNCPRATWRASKCDLICIRLHMFCQLESWFISNPNPAQVTKTRSTSASSVEATKSGLSETGSWFSISMICDWTKTLMMFKLRKWSRARTDLTPVQLQDSNIDLVVSSLQT